MKRTSCERANDPVRRPVKTGCALKVYRCSSRLALRTLLSEGSLQLKMFLIHWRSSLFIRPRLKQPWSQSHYCCWGQQVRSLQANLNQRRVSMSPLVNRVLVLGAPSEALVQGDFVKFPGIPRIAMVLETTGVGPPVQRPQN